MEQLVGGGLFSCNLLDHADLRNNSLSRILNYEHGSQNYNNTGYDGK